MPADARRPLSRRVRGMLAVAVAGMAVTAAPALSQQAGPVCPPGRVAVADGCLAQARVSRDITRIVRRTMRSERLKAAVYRVQVGGRDVVTGAQGESMTGVPARPAMRWRIGSIAFPLLATVALQLQDEGIVDLDAPIARWRPELPDAGAVTLRMLLNQTSGYQDYVRYEPFITAVESFPFRQFTERELLRYSFARSPKCAPGSCWSYSHANFLIAQQILAQATGTPFGRLLERRVLRPAGLTRTVASATPQIPDPVLHAFTAERGTYEESTFWNPSWTTGRGGVLTSTVGDVVRAARVVGTGRLISPAAYAELVSPAASRFAPWTPERYYALGLFVDHGWLLQNPSFFGYAGAMGYLPERGIALAVTSTKLPGADVSANVSYTILTRIAAYLTPGAAPS